MNKINVGFGQAKALVLSPILADWEEAKSVIANLDFLFDRYNLIMYDSLSFIKKDYAGQLSKYLNIWESFLVNCLDDVDLVIGFSFGGTLLQHLLNKLPLKNKKIIFMSSPAFVTDDLRKKLDEFLSLVEMQAIEQLLARLSFYSSPKSPQSKYILPLDSDQEEMLLRLKHGFSLISQADARNIIASVLMDYLHIYGEESLLAGSNNIEVSPGAMKIGIPNSGIRVLNENKEQAIKEIINYMGWNKSEF